MKDWIKDYFSFNRGEQRGLAILLGLMFLSVIFSIFAPHLALKKTYDMGPFQEQAEAFLGDSSLIHSKTQTIHSSSAYQSIKEEKTSIPRFLDAPFYFDPNDIDREIWKKTGLKDKVVENILKYRDKGGKFRAKEDLKKIYGMPDSIYRIIEPYIVIAEVKTVHFTGEKKDKTYHTADTGTIIVKNDPPGMTELNTADSAALTKLPGIGPSFASRIIKFRDMMGGFALVSQLNEVRGMDSARYALISGRVTADPLKIKKMDLNKVTFKEMLRHPYFEYHMVKSIFHYKDKAGTVKSLDELREVENMYPELLEKILPYLEVNIPED